MWFQKAAEQGHDMAQYSLGMCYFNGKGVARSESRAVFWFKEAAIQGNQSAKRMYINCSIQPISHFN